MKVRDVIRLLEADGWYQVRMRGIHRQFKHPAKGNYIHGSTRSRADSDYATMVFPGPDSPWRLAKSGAVRSRLSRCLPVLGPPQAISGLIEDSPRPRPHCPNPAFLLDLSNVNS